MGPRLLVICLLGLVGFGLLSKEVSAATNITSRHTRNQVWDASGSPYYLQCGTVASELRIESAVVYLSPECEIGGIEVEGTVSIYNSTFENVILSLSTVDLNNVTRSNFIGCLFFFFQVVSTKPLTMSIQTSQIQSLKLQNYNTIFDYPSTVILQDCELTGLVAMNESTKVSSLQLIRTSVTNLRGSLPGDFYTQYQFTDSVFFWDNDTSTSISLGGSMFFLSGCKFLAGTGADVSILWYYSFVFQMLESSLEGFQNGLQLYAEAIDHFDGEYGPLAKIHQCRFQNNPQYNLVYDSTLFDSFDVFVNATSNWWGSNYPDAVEASIKTVDDGPVYYLPFLESPPS